MSEPIAAWSATDALIEHNTLWSPGMVGLNQIADIVIAIAFLTIPLLLLHIARRRPDFRAGPLLFSFSLVSVCCGVLSLLDIGSLNHSMAWLSVSLKILGGLASLIAAGLLWKALPGILTMPSDRQLRETNDSLARATRELEAFTASVSHDLRSPLTTIAGQAGLLELSLGDRANEDQRRRLSRIQGSVKQMSELIDALLVLSRISRHTLHRELVDVSAIADAVIGELRQNDPMRAVQVKIQPGITVHGDRRLISDLVTNLLANSWKFTSKTAEPHIEMTASTSGYMATLQVRDNGAGFDMAYSQKLFKPFQRLHGPSEFTGSGIGLATVARIVERHGGRIWAEAKPLQGAVFHFTLPAMPITDEFLIRPRIN
jgi:light-regulated signal transduction histidine kinase (bacteriophytochrome)